MSDAVELMERVRRGDAGAFETLYDEYHRLVYGVAFRVLSDPAGAEDVTQNVFLKLWSNPASFVSGNFGAWIIRVARNRAVDALRARATHPESGVPEALAERDSLEDTAFVSLNAEAVRKALVQLPPEQRELIELGFFGGVTHHEIARKTGLPLGTVKTRIRAGLRRLRSALEGVVVL
ncbi:MAG TPA: sigma-70 family RNA polymerase sigma factor [Candidatus Cybelea sp.]|jgi:RNA polymerase sigma-70 factor (ECF subfamily)|nr:sigma-70 family RNA polymerase sigma factor [Candidatus Cybelea sp.]